MDFKEYESIFKKGSEDSVDLPRFERVIPDPTDNKIFLPKTNLDYPVKWRESGGPYRGSLEGLTSILSKETARRFEKTGIEVRSLVAPLADEQEQATCTGFLELYAEPHDLIRLTGQMPSMVKELDLSGDTVITSTHSNVAISSDYEVGRLRVDLHAFQRGMSKDARSAFDQAVKSSDDERSEEAERFREALQASVRQSEQIEGVESVSFPLANSMRRATIRCAVLVHEASGPVEIANRHVVRFCDFDPTPLFAESSELADALVEYARTDDLSAKVRLDKALTNSITQEHLETLLVDGTFEQRTPYARGGRRGSLRAMDQVLATIGSDRGTERTHDVSADHTEVTGSKDFSKSFTAIREYLAAQQREILRSELQAIRTDLNRQTIELQLRSRSIGRELDQISQALARLEHRATSNLEEVRGEIAEISRKLEHRQYTEQVDVSSVHFQIFDEDEQGQEQEYPFRDQDYGLER